MSRKYCPWCASTWPTLRPCCPADLDYLHARDHIIEAGRRARMPFYGEWLRRRDADLPEIFQHRFSPPDDPEE
jgi:hypothetical protein